MSAKKTNTLTTLTLRPSDVSMAIRAVRTAGHSVFLWGPPGISKSAVSNQLATDDGIAFIDVRLSQMDPSDLRGIPFPIKLWGENGVKWSTPLAWPRNLNMTSAFEIPFAEPETFSFSDLNPKGSNGIHYCTNVDIAVRAIGTKSVARIISQTLDSVEVALFAVDEKGVATDVMVAGHVRVSLKGKAKAIIALEEFNSAPPSVQAASYQLILDRRLGEYVIPDDCYLMAMGNRETDKGISFRLPTPVVNRFIHLEMQVNFNDWFSWALKNRIHPAVVGYLGHFKDDLFNFDPGTAARGFQTPRSWEFVSNIITKNEHMSDAVLRGVLMGAIGDAGGAKFVEFLSFSEELPDPESILNGSLKKMPKKVELQHAFALVTSLCYELKDRAMENIRKNGKEGAAKSPERKKWLLEADNFMEFTMENFQVELVVMAARQAIKEHKLPFDAAHMKHFRAFAESRKDMILA